MRLFTEKNGCSIGVVPEEKLFAFSQKIIYMLAVSIAVTMVIGLVGSILVSHHLAKPVLKLSEEVEEAQKTRSNSISLSKTGIRELDQFAGAITQLSQDIVHTSTKIFADHGYGQCRARRLRNPF